LASGEAFPARIGGTTNVVGEPRSTVKRELYGLRGVDVMVAGVKEAEP